MTEQIKIVYCYDKETKVFTSKYECQPSPLEPNKFLVPPYATEIKPPKEKEKFNIIFNNRENSEENQRKGGWEYQEIIATKPIKTTFEELKQQMLNEAYWQCQNSIYTQYPPYKQSNLAIDGTEEEKATFIEFRNRKRNKYYGLIAMINKAKNTEDLGEILTDYDH